MKKFILIFLFLLGVTPIKGQNFADPLQREKVAYTDTTTTFTYQIKNTKYKVFKGKRGSFYIYRTSTKTKKKYKYYLPKDIQIKMGRKYPS